MTVKLSTVLFPEVVEVPLMLRPVVDQETLLPLTVQEAEALDTAAMPSITADPAGPA